MPLKCYGVLKGAVLHRLRPKANKDHHQWKGAAPDCGEWTVEGKAVGVVVLHDGGVFDFDPGSGIHDIHMNRGNVPRFKNGEGVWQDGALGRRFAGVSIAGLGYERTGARKEEGEGRRGVE